MTLDELTNKIAEFEGFRPTVYKDYGGVPTIGFGFTNQKYIEMGTMTIEQGLEILRGVVEGYYNKVKSNINYYHYDMNENQIMALTSFTYNCGQSNLDKLLDYGKRDIITIGDKITLYNKCKGDTLNGLVKRRAWEQDLYFTRVTNNNVSRETFTEKDIQVLCNKIITQKGIGLTPLTVDGIIGKKSREVVYKLLSILLTN